MNRRSFFTTLFAAPLAGMAALRMPIAVRKPVTVGELMVRIGMSQEQLAIDFLKEWVGGTLPETGIVDG